MLKVLFTTLLLAAYIDAALALAAALVALIFIERVTLAQRWLPALLQLAAGVALALPLRVAGGVGVWSLRALLLPRRHNAAAAASDPHRVASGGAAAEVSLRDFSTERLFVAALLYAAALPYTRQLEDTAFPIGIYATAFVALALLVASDFLVGVERQEARSRLPGAEPHNFMRRAEFYGTRVGLVAGGVAYADIVWQQVAGGGGVWQAALPLVMFAGILLLSYVQSAVLELERAATRRSGHDKRLL